MLERALRVLCRLVAWLPWGALRVAGRGLGLLAGSVLRIRRRDVEAAMRRAGIDDARASARAMYGSLGAGVLELLWWATRGEEAVVAVALDAESAARLDAALARGPVVVAASHTGNWELAAFAAARVVAGQGRRLAIVAKPLRVRGFDAFCARLRRAAGLRVIAPRGALAAAREALAQGDVVAMPIDQVPERAAHAVVGPFLGRPALLDRAPAALAARAGATLLVVAAERDGERHRVRILGALRPHRHAGPAWIASATREANALLDAFVRRAPSSWLWLHRRWRLAPLPGGD
jgi:KDO2-lipid IV(A) lauroyltransferase